MFRKTLCLLASALMTLVNAGAQTADSTRVFSDEHPLVYEDAWDLWPYAFLNENGEAVGYNIDLMKMIFGELGIPYVVRLKSTETALYDLKHGHSDLMLGMDAHFHNEYAEYGNVVVQIFTHSVLHRKDDPSFVQRFSDLATNTFIVHKGAFSHHLVMSKGWGENAIPYDDMREAVQKVHNTSGMQIVWNTMSLKWLLNTMHFDDLELTPLDMAHGEYKFMSNNLSLLHKVDSAFTVLQARGALRDIQTKWFYPERHETGIPSWIWYVVLALLVAAVAFTIYYVVYRVIEKHMTRNLQQSNNRLSMILSTGKVGIWVYNIATRTIMRIGTDGTSDAERLSPAFFFYSVKPENLASITDAMHKVETRQASLLTVEVETRSGSDGAVRNLKVALSVLRTDKNGHPTDIMGTTSDITEERERQRRVRDTVLRYQNVFDSSMVDTVAYDEHGVIYKMNNKACSAFKEDMSDIQNRHITLSDVLGEDIDVSEMEGVYLTQLYRSTDDERALMRHLQRPEMYYELQLVPVRSADGSLLALYGTGRDVTETVRSYRQLKQDAARLQAASDSLNDYVHNIDFVLQNGGVRMATYSPDTHTMTIFSEINRPQYQLTQTRGIVLVAPDQRPKARRLLNSMDNRIQATLKDVVKTTLRVKGGKRLSLYVSFIPVTDENGRITEYFGMFRDVTEIICTEEQLALETEKAQEVETVKNAFLRNMSYEIRTPLTSVVGFAELFEMEHEAAEEEQFIGQIKDNSVRLLKLINDILFLSRLDAHMIELKPQPTDFAGIFDGRCQMAWAGKQKADVSCRTDNPYKRLVVDVDMQNLGTVIDHLVGNAMQFTDRGEVLARYDYTGDELVLAISDTGCGISPSRMDHIFDRFGNSASQGTGLGLAICHEMVTQMGGRINIKSTPGQGTIVWVSIPCQCTELERK